MAKTKELKKRSWGQDRIVFVRFGSRLPSLPALLSANAASAVLNVASDGGGYARGTQAPGGHGDLWLSQKGKLGNINPNPPPGSRRDLFEVSSASGYFVGWGSVGTHLHPDAVHRRTYRAALPQHWGKLLICETTRDAQVVHQSDGRLVPGRSPGDTWIEAKGKSFMPGCGNYPYDVPRVLGVGVVETSLRDDDGKPTIPRSGLKPMSRHQME